MGDIVSMSHTAEAGSNTSKSNIPDENRNINCYKIVIKIEIIWSYIQ